MQPSRSAGPSPPSAELECLKGIAESLQRREANGAKQQLKCAKDAAAVAQYFDAMLQRGAVPTDVLGQHVCCNMLVLLIDCCVRPALLHFSAGVAGATAKAESQVASAPQAARALAEVQNKAYKVRADIIKPLRQLVDALHTQLQHVAAPQHSTGRDLALLYPPARVGGASDLCVGGPHWRQERRRDRGALPCDGGTQWEGELVDSRMSLYPRSNQPYAFYHADLCADDASGYGDVADASTAGLPTSYASVTAAATSRLPAARGEHGDADGLCGAMLGSDANASSSQLPGQSMLSGSSGGFTNLGAGPSSLALPPLSHAESFPEAPALGTYVEAARRSQTAHGSVEGVVIGASGARSWTEVWSCLSSRNHRAAERHYSGAFVLPLLWKDCAPLQYVVNHAIEVLQSEVLSPFFAQEYASLLLRLLVFPAYRAALSPAAVEEITTRSLELLAYHDGSSAASTSEAALRGGEARLGTSQRAAPPPMALGLKLQTDACTQIASVLAMTLAAPHSLQSLRSPSATLQTLLALTSRVHAPPVPSLKLAARLLVAVKLLTRGAHLSEDFWRSTQPPQRHSDGAVEAKEVLLQLGKQLLHLWHATLRWEDWRMEALELLTTALSATFARRLAISIRSHCDSQTSTDSATDSVCRSGLPPASAVTASAATLDPSSLSVLHESVYGSLLGLMSVSRSEFSFVSRRELAHTPCTPLQPLFDYAALVVYLVSVTLRDYMMLRLASLTASAFFREGDRAPRKALVVSLTPYDDVMRHLRLILGSLTSTAVAWRAYDDATPAPAVPHSPGASCLEASGSECPLLTSPRLRWIAATEMKDGYLFWLHLLGQPLATLAFSRAECSRICEHLVEIIVAASNGAPILRSQDSTAASTTSISASLQSLDDESAALVWNLDTRCVEELAATGTTAAERPGEASKYYHLVTASTSYASRLGSYGIPSQASVPHRGPVAAPEPQDVAVRRAESNASPVPPESRSKFVNRVTSSMVRLEQLALAALTVVAPRAESAFQQQLFQWLLSRYIAVPSEALLSAGPSVPQVSESPIPREECHSGTADAPRDPQQRVDALAATLHQCLGAQAERVDLEHLNQAPQGGHADVITPGTPALDSTRRRVLSLLNTLAEHAILGGWSLSIGAGTSRSDLAKSPLLCSFSAEPLVAFRRVLVTVVACAAVTLDDAAVIFAGSGAARPIAPSHPKDGSSTLQRLSRTAQLRGAAAFFESLSRLVPSPGTAVGFATLLSHYEQARCPDWQLPLVPDVALLTQLLLSTAWVASSREMCTALAHAEQCSLTEPSDVENCNATCDRPRHPQRDPSFSLGKQVLAALPARKGRRPHTAIVFRRLLSVVDDIVAESCVKHAVLVEATGKLGRNPRGVHDETPPSESCTGLSWGARSGEYESLLRRSYDALDTFWASPYWRVPEEVLGCCDQFWLLAPSRTGRHSPSHASMQGAGSANRGLFVVHRLSCDTSARDEADSVTTGVDAPVAMLPCVRRAHDSCDVPCHLVRAMAETAAAVTVALHTAFELLGTDDASCIGGGGGEQRAGLGIADKDAAFLVDDLAVASIQLLHVLLHLNEIGLWRIPRWRKPEGAAVSIGLLRNETQPCADKVPAEECSRLMTLLFSEGLPSVEETQIAYGWLLGGAKPLRRERSSRLSHVAAANAEALGQQRAERLLTLLECLGEPVAPWNGERHGCEFETSLLLSALTLTEIVSQRLASRSTSPLAGNGAILLAPLKFLHEDVGHVLVRCDALYACRGSHVGEGPSAGQRSPLVRWGSGLFEWLGLGCGARRGEEGTVLPLLRGMSSSAKSHEASQVVYCLVSQVLEVARSQLRLQRQLCVSLAAAGVDETDLTALRQRITSQEEEVFHVTAGALVAQGLLQASAVGLASNATAGGEGGPRSGHAARLPGNRTGEGAGVRDAVLKPNPHIAGALHYLESAASLLLSIENAQANHAALSVMEMLFHRYRHSLLPLLLRLLCRFPLECPNVVAATPALDIQTRLQELMVMVVEVVFPGGCGVDARDRPRHGRAETSAVLPPLASVTRTPITDCGVVFAAAHVLHCTDVTTAEALGKFIFSLLSPASPLSVTTESSLAPRRSENRVTVSTGGQTTSSTSSLFLRCFVAVHVTSPFNRFAERDDVVLHELLYCLRGALLSDQPSICITGLLALRFAASHRRVVLQQTLPPSVAPVRIQWIHQEHALVPTVVSSLMEYHSIRGFRHQALVQECLSGIASEVLPRALLRGGIASTWHAFTALCESHKFRLCFEWLVTYSHPIEAIPVSFFGFATLPSFAKANLTILLPIACLQLRKHHVSSGRSGSVSTTTETLPPLLTALVGLVTRETPAGERRTLLDEATNLLYAHLPQVLGCLLAWSSPCPPPNSPLSRQTSQPTHPPQNHLHKEHRQQQLRGTPGVASLTGQALAVMGQGRGSPIDQFAAYELACNESYVTGSSAPPAVSSRTATSAPQAVTSGFGEDRVRYVAPESCHIPDSEDAVRCSAEYALQWVLSMLRQACRAFEALSADEIANGTAVSPPNPFLALLCALHHEDKQRAQRLRSRRRRMRRRQHDHHPPQQRCARVRGEGDCEMRHCPSSASANRPGVLVEPCSVVNTQTGSSSDACSEDDEMRGKSGGFFFLDSDSNSGGEEVGHESIKQSRRRDAQQRVNDAHAPAVIGIAPPLTGPEAPSRTCATGATANSYCSPFARLLHYFADESIAHLLGLVQTPARTLSLTDAVALCKHSCEQSSTRTETPYSTVDVPFISACTGRIAVGRLCTLIQSELSAPVSNVAGAGSEADMHAFFAANHGEHALTVLWRVFHDDDGRPGDVVRAQCARVASVVYPIVADWLGERAMMKPQVLRLLIQLLCLGQSDGGRDRRGETLLMAHVAKAHASERHPLSVAATTEALLAPTAAVEELAMGLLLVHVWKVAACGPRNISGSVRADFGHLASTILAQVGVGSAVAAATWASLLKVTPDLEQWNWLHVLHLLAQRSESPSDRPAATVTMGLHMVDDTGADENGGSTGKKDTSVLSGTEMTESRALRILKLVSFAAGDAASAVFDVVAHSVDVPGNPMRQLVDRGFRGETVTSGHEGMPSLGKADAVVDSASIRPVLQNMIGHLFGVAVGATGSSLHVKVNALNLLRAIWMVSESCSEVAHTASTSLEGKAASPSLFHWTVDSRVGSLSMQSTRVGQGACAFSYDALFEGNGTTLDDVFVHAYMGLTARLLGLATDDACRPTHALGASEILQCLLRSRSPLMKEVIGILEGTGTGEGCGGSLAADILALDRPMRLRRVRSRECSSRPPQPVVERAGLRSLSKVELTAAGVSFSSLSALDLDGDELWQLLKEPSHSPAVVQFGGTSTVHSPLSDTEHRFLAHFLASLSRQYRLDTKFDFLPALICFAAVDAAVAVELLPVALLHVFAGSRENDTQREFRARWTRNLEVHLLEPVLRASPVLAAAENVASASSESQSWSRIIQPRSKATQTPIAASRSHEAELECRIDGVRKLWVSLAGSPPHSPQSRRASPGSESVHKAVRDALVENLRRPQRAGGAKTCAGGSHSEVEKPLGSLTAFAYSRGVVGSRTLHRLGVSATVEDGGTGRSPNRLHPRLARLVIVALNVCRGASMSSIRQLGLKGPHARKVQQIVSSAADPDSAASAAAKVHAGLPGRRGISLGCCGAVSAMASISESWFLSDISAITLARTAVACEEWDLASVFAELACDGALSRPGLQPLFSSSGMADPRAIGHRWSSGASATCLFPGIRPSTRHDGGGLTKELSKEVQRESEAVEMFANLYTALQPVLLAIAVAQRDTDRISTVCRSQPSAWLRLLDDVVHGNWERVMRASTGLAEESSAERSSEHSRRTITSQGIHNKSPLDSAFARASAHRLSLDYCGDGLRRGAVASGLLSLGCAHAAHEFLHASKPIHSTYRDYPVIGETSLWEVAGAASTQRSQVDAEMSNRSCMEEVGLQWAMATTRAEDTDFLHPSALALPLQRHRDNGTSALLRSLRAEAAWRSGQWSDFTSVFSEANTAALVVDAGPTSWHSFTAPSASIHEALWSAISSVKHRAPGHAMAALLVGKVAVLQSVCSSTLRATSSSGFASFSLPNHLLRLQALADVESAARSQTVDEARQHNGLPTAGECMTLAAQWSGAAEPSPAQRSYPERSCKELMRGFAPLGPNTAASGTGTTLAAIELVHAVRHAVLAVSLPSTEALSADIPLHGACSGSEAHRLPTTTTSSDTVAVLFGRHGVSSHLAHWVAQLRDGTMRAIADGRAHVAHTWIVDCERAVRGHIARLATECIDHAARLRDEEDEHILPIVCHALVQASPTAFGGAPGADASRTEKARGLLHKATASILSAKQYLQKHLMQMAAEVTKLRADVNYAIGDVPLALGLLRSLPDASARPDVVWRVVTWSRQAQLAPTSQLVRDPIFSKASGADKSGRCSFAMARMCDELCTEIEERLTSREQVTLRDSLVASMQTRDELEQRLQERGNQLTEEDEKLIRTRIRLISLDVQRETADIKEAVTDFMLYHRSAMHSYARYLHLGAGGSHAVGSQRSTPCAGDHNMGIDALGVATEPAGNEILAVFRFVALWLRRVQVERVLDVSVANATSVAGATQGSRGGRSSTSASAAFAEMVRSGSAVTDGVVTKSLSAIPLAKFLRLLPQLVARLGTVDDDRLEQLLLRLAEVHPLRVVWSLLAVSSGTTFTAAHVRLARHRMAKIATEAAGSAKGEWRAAPQKASAPQSGGATLLSASVPRESRGPATVVNSSGSTSEADSSGDNDLSLHATPVGAAIDEETCDSQDRGRHARKRPRPADAPRRNPGVGSLEGRGCHRRDRGATKRTRCAGGRCAESNDLGDDTDGSLEADEGKLCSIDLKKVACARRLLRAIKCSTNTLGSIVHEAEVLRAGYLQLAHHRGSLSLKVQQIPSEFLLRHLPVLRIPPPTSTATTVTSTTDGGLAPGRIYVCGYHPTYDMVGGINCPKAVRCQLSDGTTAKQLLKANDDMRQDAILEQFFVLCNELLCSDAVARRQRLSMRTYTVAPLAPTTGIIEWVDGTIPFGQYLVGQGGAGVAALAAAVAKGSLSSSEVTIGAHDRYFPSEPTSHDCREKLKVASTVKKSDTLRSIFEEFTPSLHYFFLERFLSSPESVVRRQQYTRSVAVSSIVGYAIGLGDRHGSNLLLDQRTAEVVHIDLGFAFEQGKLLPIPERVPFRLTRDVVDGMGVYATQGGFRTACEATMVVLRNRHELLVTVLEAFLHDPLAKWALRVAPLSARPRATRSDSRAPPNSTQLATSSGWGHLKQQREHHDAADAKRALSRVEEKLRGYDGGELHSVQAHVQKLIQMAQNTELLAQMFVGWSPWL